MQHGLSGRAWGQGDPSYVLPLIQSSHSSPIYKFVETIANCLGDGLWISTTLGQPWLDSSSSALLEPTWGWPHLGLLQPAGAFMKMWSSHCQKKPNPFLWDSGELSLCMLFWGAYGRQGERECSIMVTGCILRESTLQSEERAVLWKLYGKRDAQAVLAVLCSLKSLYDGVVRWWEETALYCGMSFLSISFWERNETCVLLLNLVFVSCLCDKEQSINHWIKQL